MLRQPDPLAERKCLSFEQAEGIAPAAESPGTQSDFTGVYRSLPEFRALTWRMLKQQLERTRDVTLVPARVGEPWRPILQDAQVHYHHSLDDFPAPYQTPCVSFEV